jgi:hypothetical protein
MVCNGLFHTYLIPSIKPSTVPTTASLTPKSKLVAIDDASGALGSSALTGAADGVEQPLWLITTFVVCSL